MNATLEKFAYPETIIQSYQHWVVLLRPQQVTLGSLILGSLSDSQAFGQLSSAAMNELQVVTKEIELTLSHCFNYDKINYLMLMMVDPHVHFHVIPRYSNEREFGSQTLLDPDWPGPPNLATKQEIAASQLEQLRQFIQNHWIQE